MLACLVKAVLPRHLRSGMRGQHAGPGCGSALRMALPQSARAYQRLVLRTTGRAGRTGTSSRRVFSHGLGGSGSAGHAPLPPQQTSAACACDKLLSRPFSPLPVTDRHAAASDTTSSIPGILRRPILPGPPSSLALQMQMQMQRPRPRPRRTRPGRHVPCFLIRPATRSYYQ